MYGILQVAETSLENSKIININLENRKNDSTKCWVLDWSYKI